MEFTKRLLEQFLALAEERHFGRAAQRLSMSQPPLSQAMQRLERGLGVTLLDRRPGDLRLTPAGTAFAVEARRLLDAQSAVVERVRRVAHGLEGDVRVGYVSILSHRHLPRLLRAAAEELPGLRVHLHQDATVTLVEMLRSGALDLAFIRDPSPVPDDLVVHDFAVERIVAALPDEHRLAGAASVALSDLREDDFVLLSETALPGLARQARLACGESGFTPRRRADADDLTGLLGYVAAGLCVSLMPEDLRDFPVPGITFVPLREASPYLRTTVAAVRRADADAAVHRLLDLITRHTGP
ncbi:LysR family transcriptional regulator [Streptomyces eurocidicus]|uniref:DNA-binding transcriptional LysR family regulator n=1 Tax=Streptomyces eurocidicus TaxID=66423 RepID=A0A2N8NUD7_STREU|nr:LysR substrate-binding domain-containing protein [Streptomyces eurocidicus]MBB5120233.1 DNA-binding transcriptional LysR family regulator [Streptomyces eurocidicus]MBF6056084.1 LysR family transcriptional regulator [Streptomyces eurocidicus]PNE32381.1 LysR family transcriptional regulator [Streptomyces eurocidicus]